MMRCFAAGYDDDGILRAVECAHSFNELVIAADDVMLMRLVVVKKIESFVSG